MLAALTTAGLVVHPRMVALIAPGGASLSYPNPLAAGDPGPVLRTVLVGTLNGLSAVFLPFLRGHVYLAGCQVPNEARPGCCASRSNGSP